MNSAKRLERVEGAMLIALCVLGLAMAACIHVLREPAISSISQVYRRPVAVSNMSIYGIWQAANQARADAGMAPLALSSGLTKAAQAKCSDMVAKGYWAHNDPAGTTPWHFLTEAGVAYKQSAESLTLGYTTTPSVVHALLANKEYKANLLSPAYTQTGFAACAIHNYQHKGPKLFVVEFLAN